MKDCVGRGQKLVWFSSNFSFFVTNSFCRWHSNEKIDSKFLFNVHSFEGCVGMTHKFWCHLALWWVKKETLHFVLSFGKIALSKLLQNVESPFRGAAPLKAHIAPQDPDRTPMAAIYPWLREFASDPWKFNASCLILCRLSLVTWKGYRGRNVRWYLFIF